MAQNIDDLMQDVQKEYASKVYEYWRWLVLLVAGAFSLSFKILIDADYENELVKTIVRLALTFNALGVVSGALIAASQHIELGTYKIELANEIIKQRKGHQPRSRLSINLPIWLRPARIICLSSLILSISCWIIFIWMV